MSGLIRAVWGARTLPRWGIVVWLLALQMPASINSNLLIGGCHSTWGCAATSCTVNQDSSSSSSAHSSGGTLTINLATLKVTCGQEIINCSRTVTRELDMHDGSDPQTNVTSVSCCQPESQAGEDGVCSCNAGFTKNTSVPNTDAWAPLCSPCAMDTYKDSSGEHACIECASGKYSKDGASTCTNCPTTLESSLPRANVSCSGVCQSTCSHVANAQSGEISDGPDQCEYAGVCRTMNAFKIIRFGITPRARMSPRLHSSRAKR